jgi:hypothetical protein
MSGLMLVMALCCAKRGLAQPSDSTPPLAARPMPVVHPVLIPIDEQQQPVDVYVFVPRELFIELHRRLSDARGSQTGPLIESAHYGVELSTAQLPGDAWEVVNFRAEFELSEVVEGAQIRLPFRQDRVRVMDARPQIWNVWKFRQLSAGWSVVRSARLRPN